jgi:hypothetical protein
VLDAPATETNVFLSRESCVSKIQLNRPVWSKESLYPLEKLSFPKDSFQKVSQFSLVNKVLHAPASNTTGFVSRHTCVSSTQLNRPVGSKEILSPP